MSKKHIKSIWVHEDFAKALKINSSLKGYNMIAYSKNLAKMLENDTNNEKEQRKYEKIKFSF